MRTGNQNQNVNAVSKIGFNNISRDKLNFISQIKPVSYFLLMVFISFAHAGYGQIIINSYGSAYTQDFNTLSNVVGSTTNNLVITGWVLTEGGLGARDNEQYAVDNGNSATGDVYSYGTALASDRALGALRSGSLIPLYGVAFTNSTGGPITSLSVSYTGEEWRLGAVGRADQINFEYSLDATSLTTGTWTNVSALNFLTPETATSGAHDGNLAGNRTLKNALFNVASIPNGANFWIRIVDLDVPGSDDGLAIDDFSLTAFPPCNLSLFSFEAFTSCDSISISANITGGTAPLSYLWSTGSTNQSTPISVSGTYCVTVTDANSCNATFCSNIEFDPHLATTCSILSSACTGTTIAVTNSGGMPPYSVLWSNGATDQTTIVQTSGNYCATVTDINGCTATCCVDVTALTGPTIACSSTDVTCQGGSDGSATVAITAGQTVAYVVGPVAGQLPFQGIQWPPTPPVTGNCDCPPGYVAVGYEGGVDFLVNRLVLNCRQLLPDGTLGGALVNTCLNGTDPSGTPAGPYLGPSNNAIVRMDVFEELFPCPNCFPDGIQGYSKPMSDIIAGTSNLVGLSPHAAISFGGILPPPHSETAPTGNLITGMVAYGPHASDPTPEFTGVNFRYSPILQVPGESYLWSNGQTTSTAINLSAGTYTVTVTNGSGCTSSCSVTIGNPPPFIISCSGTSASCNGASDGSATVTGGAAGGYFVGPVDGQLPFQGGHFPAPPSIADTCDCPPGYVVTGYEGRKGSFIDQFVLKCRQLLPDGTLGATLVNTCSNGTSTGGASFAPFLAAPSSAVVQMTIQEPTITCNSCFPQGMNAGARLLTDIFAGGSNLIGVSDIGGFLTFPPATPKTETAPPGHLITGMVTYGPPPSAPNPFHNFTGVNFRYAPVYHVVGDSYLWSNGATTSTITNLSPGTYTVTVTNEDGCTASCSYTVLGAATCKACNGNVIEVDQNATVDFNVNPPVCNCPAAVASIFSYSKTGSDPALWKAIFNAGANKLVVKSGVTLTTAQVNGSAPGIVIQSTCAFEVEPGGHVVINSTNQNSGELLIQVNGDITVNGELRNESSGTLGLPGCVTVVSKCGDIIEGPAGVIQDLGTGAGACGITLLTCGIDCNSIPIGNISISGLVKAFAHAHAGDQTLNRPNVRVVSLNGQVNVFANVAEPMFDEFSNSGTLYDIYPGILSWVRDNVNPGKVEVQARYNVSVYSHGTDPTGPVRKSFGAIAAVGTASNAPGGVVNVRSLQGNIVGVNRAFDVSGRNRMPINFATIVLEAKQNIQLSILPGNPTYNPVVNASSPSIGDKGGLNLLRSYSGSILVGVGAKVTAEVPVGAGSVQGYNSLTACLGVSNSGTIAPADPVLADDNGICGPPEPGPLYNDCAALGGNFRDNGNELSINSSAHRMEVYPNPTNGKITVQFSSEQSANFTVRLYDLTGRMLVENEFKATEGENVYDVDLTGVAKGMYMLILENNNTQEQQRIIVN